MILRGIRNRLLLLPEICLVCSYAYAQGTTPPLASKPAALLTSATALALPEQTTNSIGMTFRLIKPGSFMMGSPDNEIDHNLAEDPLKHPSDESPQHHVVITKSYYLSAYEVTQADYEGVMGTNPSSFAGPKLPVEKVSWKEAQEFCSKLSTLESRKYRQPTEAEWEYACRAGSKSAYYWGPVADDSYAWTNQNAEEKTHEVGTRKPNAWGLYDMAGNVAEWCQDWKGNYTPGEQVDPRGAAGGEFRIIRGGSWAAYPLPFRSAARYGATPVSMIDFVGFRVVLEPQ
jgi:formylglycine-generating enzyme required for sulfatase activity